MYFLSEREKWGPCILNFKIYDLYSIKKICGIKFWIKVERYSGSIKFLPSRKDIKNPSSPFTPTSLLPYPIKKGRGRNKHVKVTNSNKIRKGEALNGINLEKCWLIHKTELWECHDEVMSPPPRNYILSLQNPANSHRNLERSKKNCLFLAFPNLDQEVVKIVAAEMRAKRKMSGIWHNSHACEELGNWVNTQKCSPKS